MSKIFAITGGIGSGKSTVSQIMRDNGIPIVCADSLAKKAFDNKSKEINNIFPDANLDRKKIARIVFSDPIKKELLTNIIHPVVKQYAEEEFLKYEGLIGYDIPLLFETNQEENYKPIIVVYCDRDTQIERVQKRSNLSREEVEERINAQIHIRKKIEKADYVIYNQFGMDSLITQVLEIIRKIK